MYLRPQILLGIIALLFNLGLSLSGFYNWNYDSWTHLFFASHYTNSWFDTWEPRWFGGFSVTTYPPLVAQLLALLTFAVGLDHAYMLLSLGVMVLVPIAVFSFCENFLSRQHATWAGLLAILLPSIYLANYGYGQLPTLLALVATLFMGTYLWRYLEQGRGRDVLIASLLVGITAASHHFTFIFFTPLLIAATTLTLLLSTRIEIRLLLKRLVVFGALSIPLTLLPIFPFWQFLLGTEMQTPIFHLSRINLFTDSQAFWQFFLVPYLLFLPAIPLIIVAAYKHKYLIPLVALALFLFLLGLGGSTPLPRLVFRDWWQWLTYDRFSLWAGVCFLPLLARLLPANLLGGVRKPLKPAILVFLTLVLLGGLFGAAYVASGPLRQSFLPPKADLAPLLGFLGKQDVQRYRYITLGFGEAQMQKLSTLTHARTLDGGYYTARQLPILKESGIGMIDTVKHVDPELRTLADILENAPLYNLKWVLVDDIYYYDILEKHGFRIIQSAEKNGDAIFGSVTIWEKENISPIEVGSKSEKGFWSYIWGIAPLLLLGALILTLLKVGRKNLLEKSS